MAAALAGIFIGNYREFESDCLEYTKSLLRLISESLNGGGLNEKELGKLTISKLESEALSRRNPSSRSFGYSYLAFKGKNKHHFTFYKVLVYILIACLALFIFYGLFQH